MMKFTYEKAGGAKSKRVFVPLICPNKMYEGIDISELTAGDQEEFATLVQELKDGFKVDLEQLMEDFDIKHNYRRFNPEKMTSYD